MDCRDAHYFLRLRRPGSDDLDPDAMASLDRHLACCPACAAAGRALAGFDAAVGRAMRAVPVPDGLRDQLFTEASVRRGAALRRRTFRLLAAAASVLVTCGLALGVYSAARPQADVAGMLAQGDELAMPQGAEKQISAFLKSQRLPEPPPLDPSLFIHAGTESVQGRDVPVLVFRERNGPGVAKVYAFRATSFKLDALREEQASHCSTKLYAHPAAGVTYVVVYTGMDLTPFLRGGGGTA
ncbi:DUF3379 family protein [Urbifossiella limnaea]|uniref:Zinc-finger domain-containing protein n=1 Tax=Urbifossiella limnaea TaxID=2528023 RepID=A0A517XVH3_9BACT|nr:DUF3379 family protein [Urbifossiella limnaea]QDU21513.1 hypothetical protein ETAA1_34800 [Urbifossiella limnaea]